MSGILGILRQEIQNQGPISIHRYMEMCLLDPSFGYYRKRDPLGAKGDFTTAPEISQMFGELIGLWTIKVWQQTGSPSRLQLVELGPGRGTLMCDALRAADMVSRFPDVVDLHLVEVNEKFRNIQRTKLSKYKPKWHEDFTGVPNGPLIVIANEFFDALPIRQFERRAEGWHERLIGLNASQELDFVLSKKEIDKSLVPARHRNASFGSIIEICPAAQDVLVQFCEMIGLYGGAALIIDYGHDGDLCGDSFQAIQKHKFHSPLENPGEVDLTAHVNFGELRNASKSETTSVYGPLTQREFLLRMGIQTRAEVLSKHADEETKECIYKSLRRLIDHREMGDVFKVLVVNSKEMHAPPGFEDYDAREFK